MAKVYVSSTVADLKRERRAVMDWLVAAGHQPVHSYRPDSDTVRDSCLDDVDGCDLYVLILGHRYGFQPAQDNPEWLSITHLEFRRAGQSRIPRVALLRTSIPDVSLSDMEKPDQAMLVLAFRGEVARKVRPAEFRDLKGLISGLSTGVQAELNQLEKRTPDSVGPAGWLLAEVRDPFAVEVHRPVEPDSPRQDLPVLPAYVPREHDAELNRIVTAAAEGSSGITVLVGGSSTGKTRACWEALHPLRDQEPGWRLWHPIDPSRPDAALRELPAIRARTVVWLNDAQFYLDTADGMGERVAAGLRELLRDPARAPVLVLATLWPNLWDLLTTRPATRADPHAQARELLGGHDITVPPGFTAAQVAQLRDTGDPRLTQAATAPDGQVTQFLAGAPELLARYRNAPPAEKALINVAIDARRLGTGPTPAACVPGNSGARVPHRR